MQPQSALQLAMKLFFGEERCFSLEDNRKKEKNYFVKLYSQTKYQGVGRKNVEKLKQSTGTGIFHHPTDHEVVIWRLS